MAVLILAEIEPTDAWFSGLIAQLKKRQDLDLRVWPECGNPEEIEIVLAWWPPLGAMQKLANLKLIISLASGVEHILRDPNLPDSVPIVRLVERGKSLQMAEYVALAALLFKRRFAEYRELQRSRRWEYLPLPDNSSFAVGILGLGFLGSTVAKKLTDTGFAVRGWSRSPKTIAGVECFHGREQFRVFLSQCRAIVCLLPLTPETEGILCQETFSALAPGAYLINVGRGQHLVEADLLSALDSGQIAAACLDVFDTEPLPKEHPFWSHARIIVTPHISAEGRSDDAADFVFDAIDRYRSGRPLQYLVDRNRGY